MEAVSLPSRPQNGAARLRRHSFSTALPEEEKVKARPRFGSLENGFQKLFGDSRDTNNDGNNGGMDDVPRRLSITLAEMTSKTEEKILSLLETTRRRFLFRKPRRDPQTQLPHRRKVLVPLVRFAQALSPLVELGIEAFCAIDEAIAKNKDVLEMPFALLTLFVGMVVLFLGSHFSTSIAFISAMQKGVGEHFSTDLSLLRGQFFEAQRVLLSLESTLKKKQREELEKKKLRALLISLDPILVADVTAGFWRGLLFAGATAKLQHAKIISLGITLGEQINRPVQRYFVPILKDETNEDLHRWYESFFNQVCYLVGVLIAFRISTIIGIVATSLRGARIVIMGAKDAFQLSIDEEGEDIALALLFILGVIIQSGFTHVPVPSFLYMIVYFPMFFIENWVIAFIRWI